jgi:hypothetical protein
VYSVPPLTHRAVATPVGFGSPFVKSVVPVVVSDGTAAANPAAEKTRTETAAIDAATKAMPT